MMDKLIDGEKISATICVFINSGEFIDPKSSPHNSDTQRSIEYDSMSDQYSRFLINELLPEALFNLNITHDASRRTMTGFSSGGICAWTVAWLRSDLFGNVLRDCGSYVDIRSGGIINLFNSSFPRLSN